MASRLLDVLNNIEKDRKYLVDIAQKAGYSVSDKASFHNIDVAIQPIHQSTDIPDSGIPKEWVIEEEWVRPIEWPDCHQILLDTPINGSNIPYMILLLRDGDDEIELAKSLNGISSSMTTDAIAYSAILTSDGVFYNNPNETRTHTWDKSKDIIVTDGEYPGTYRWLLYYGASNGTYNGGKWLKNMRGVVECILDCSKFPTQSSSGYSPIIFYGASCNNIVNIEVFNVERVYMQVAMGNPYIYGFSGCTELRNLDFHDCPGVMSNGSFSGDLFTNCRKLQYIDLSNIEFGLSGSNTGSFNLTNCYSLKSFKGPITSQSQPAYSMYMYIIKLGYNPYLKLLQTDLRENTQGEVNLDVVNTYTWANTYIPKDITFVGKYYGKALPHNWEGHSYFGNKLYSDTTYPKTSSNYPYLYIYDNVFCRDVIDFSSVLSYTNDSTNFSCSVYSSSQNSYINIPYSPDSSLISVYLKNKFLIFPENVCIRITFTTSIGRQNIISLFNCLKDLTLDERTANNPFIKFYYTDMKELTPEDIEIATNKGWIIQ